MRDVSSQDVVQGLVIDPGFQHQIRMHLVLLGHYPFGVTELRIFDPFPSVAYADSADAVIRLCRQMDGKAAGIYVGCQPRPAHCFDQAPNCWVPARGGPRGNCTRDADIEFVVVLVWDIDVVSPQRQLGHPASDEELKRTLLAAQLLTRQEWLALACAIVCTGNGHQVWAPIVPVSVDGPQVALQFKQLCEQIAADVANKVNGVRIDPIFNLSRVARLCGPWNRKGRPLADRPHRRAHFVTEPPLGRSFALHQRLINIEVQEVVRATQPIPQGLKCDLAGIERCEFIRWCRRHAKDVSEPLWWGLLTNLAHLEGGIPLAHEISQMDACRYDHAETQRVIERIVREGYKPVNCASLMSPSMVRPGRGVFHCGRIGTCRAKAPMYTSALKAIPGRRGGTNMESAANKRVKVFSCGAVTATLWITPRVRDDKVVEVVSIKFDKSYEAEGQRKYATTFYDEDLPKIALLAMEAYRFLIACRGTASHRYERDDSQLFGHCPGCSCV